MRGIYSKLNFMHHLLSENIQSNISRKAGDSDVIKSKKTKQVH